MHARTLKLFVGTVVALAVGACGPAAQPEFEPQDAPASLEAQVQGGFCAGKQSGYWCDGDSLVRCSAYGAEVSRSVCTNGCEQKPVGQPDVCRAAPSTCAAGQDPVISSPAEGASVATRSVQLVWCPAANTASQRVELYFDDLAVGLTRVGPPLYLDATASRASFALPRQGVKYVWVVAATLTTGEARTAVASFTTPSPVEHLSTPINLRPGSIAISGATRVSPRITLAWDAPPSHPGDFNLQVALYNGDQWVNLINTQAPNQGFDVNLPYPTRYYAWRVRSTYAGQSSDWSPWHYLFTNP